MYSRIVHLMAILLVLSACAQNSPSERPTVSRDQAGQQIETKQQNAEAPPTSIRNARYHQRETAHHHHAPAPTPEEQYAATVALLISAQIFACAFVVVILDGHCSLYVGTGYYY